MKVAESTLGPLSHGKLLDIIRSGGPISRVEIAEIAGLTQASVSTIVRSLLNEGLVHEVGRVESTGGKRRTQLEIVPNARYAIGVHLGLESIVYVITNMAGGMIGRQRRAGAGSAAPGEVIERIGDEIDELVGALGVDRAFIVGVGIVAAGPINYSAGVIIGSPAQRHWNAFPLREELAKRTGLPVVLDKDATAAAIGEFWGGRADVPSSFACLYMGTGIGAGIVIDGSAFRGSASNAGEVGHVSLDVRGARCSCGNRGCLEVLAAPLAVVTRARGVDEDIPPMQPNEVSRAFDGIARQAVSRNEQSLALIRESAEYMAEGVLTLVNIIDLDLIVLGGPGFAIAGAIYIEAIRSVLAERFFARDSHGVEVRFSTNPRDAAALGASALVLQQLLAPRG
ncbi:ROK family transcriptional regulator [Glaciihabitans sp. UYNi722]|uniref:ROK family transcriptional regulator n=1 Tax=Glaciihabitans sp. UYNi722 TaxID=3156344 RepID=UPI0033908E8F